MEQCSVRDAAIKLQTWFLVPAAGGSHELIGKEPRPEISAGKEPPEPISEKHNRVGEDGTNKPLTFDFKTLITPTRT